MERRSEPRFPSDLAVEVTVLSDPDTLHAGHVIDLSGRGLRIWLEVSLASGTAIKVATPDCLALAETSFCLQVGHGFLIGVRLDEILSGTPDLERLQKSLRTRPSSSDTPGQRIRAR